MTTSISSNYNLSEIKQKQKTAFPLDVDIKKSIIKEIVKKTFIELATSLTFAGIACLFVATPIGMATFFIAAVASVALSILFRSLIGYASYRIQQLEDSDQIDDKIKLQRFKVLKNFINNLLPSPFVSLVDVPTRLSLSNPTGQALVANLLYKAPSVKITLQAFKPAEISIAGGELSKLGTFFGKDKTELLIAGAAPAFTIATSCIGIITSLSLRKSHPELSQYLSKMAIENIFQTAFQALSAIYDLGAKGGANFLKLSAAGIHPAASIATIVAVPILTRLGFFIYEKIKAHRQEKSNKLLLKHVEFPKPFKIHRLRQGYAPWTAAKGRRPSALPQPKLRQI